METALTFKEKTVTISPNHHAGMIGEHINPIVPQIQTTILACDLLMGRDQYSMRWIKAFRAREKAKAEAA